MNNALYAKIKNLENRIQEMQKVPRDIQSILKDLKTRTSTMESRIWHLQIAMDTVNDKYDNTPPNTFERLRVLEQLIGTNRKYTENLEIKLDHFIHSVR